MLLVACYFAKWVQVFLSLSSNHLVIVFDGRGPLVSREAVPTSGQRPSAAPRRPWWMIQVSRGTPHTALSLFRICLNSLSDDKSSSLIGSLFNWSQQRRGMERGFSFSLSRGKEKPVVFFGGLGICHFLYTQIYMYMQRTLAFIDFAAENIRLLRMDQKLC